MTFEEKTVGTERIYEGKIINVRRDQVTVENGLSYREIVEHSGRQRYRGRYRRRTDDHGPSIQKTGGAGHAGGPGRQDRSRGSAL